MRYANPPPLPYHTPTHAAMLPCLGEALCEVFATKQLDARRVASVDCRGLSV